ncbi:15714_t:CDS:2, partial [Entrophospora sp. SA101]
MKDLKLKLESLLSIILIINLSLIHSMNSVSAGTVDEWRSRTIYQLLTDRFAQSPGQENPSLCSNNFNETEIRHYCGGTFNGIVNKLDYLKNLGFDAIWISPVVKQVEAETKYGVVQ